MPCTCPDCERGSKPHFFKYKELKARQNKGKSDHICGKHGNDVSIESVLQIILEGNDAEFLDSNKMSIRLDQFEQKMLRGHSVIGYRQKEAEGRDSKILKGQIEIKDYQKEAELRDDQVIKGQAEIKNQIKDSEIILHEIQYDLRLHREDILGIYDKIEDTSNVNIEILEEHLNIVLSHLIELIPSTDEIVQEWKKANSKDKLNYDSKVKAKFKIDLLFFVLEKELSTDAKPSLKALMKNIKLAKEDIIAWKNNEKSFDELFFTAKE